MTLRQRLWQLECKLGSCGEGLITLDELVQIFCCSRRNIQLILASLVDAGWISWSSGRGRGNRSYIVLLQSHHQLILKEAQIACQAGQLDLAMSLLVEIGAKEEFPSLLSDMVQQRRCEDGIIIPMSCPIFELDPSITVSSSDLHIIEHLYDGLIEATPNNGVRSSLAHHWEEREGGLCWHFWLRSGVRFHHGDLLTAEHVVRTFERLRSKSSLLYPLYMNIKSMKSLSVLKVEIRLITPDPFLLQLLASPHSRIISYEGLRDNLNRFTPFGTGAFKLHQRSEHHLILRRHEHYWGEFPQLEQIELWHIPPLDRQPSLWLNATPSQYEQENTVHEIHETAGCSYLIFHHLSSLWQDEELRSKLWHYLEQNRQNSSGMALAHSMFPGGYMLPPSGDCAPSGFSINRPLIIYANGSERSLPLRQWLEHCLNKLGIESEWHSLPLSLSDTTPLDCADLVLLTEVLDSQGEWGMFELLMSSSGLAMAQGHEKHLAMVHRLRNRLSLCRPEERLGLFLQQEAQLYAQYRYLPLFRQRERIIFDPRLRGVVVNHQGYCSFKHLWLDEPLYGVNICVPPSHEEEIP